jgi:ATP-binding cassette, subfamily F, member 3
MLSLNDISLRYGQKVVFNEITTVIGSHNKIGLVGSNGSGKSTLLKVIHGITEIDGGKIEKPAYVSTGYLPQDNIVVKGNTLYKEVESAFEDILSLQDKIDKASDEMIEMDTSSEEYYDLIDLIGGWEQMLEDREPQKLRPKIEKMLLGLGFTMDDLNRDTGEFSGGWQMRIALAKLLLKKPSLLLLDEPTNHLDILSQNWLEAYLKRYEGALMVISHDRAFLDAITDRTIAISLGKLTSFKGNYSYYVNESAARIEQLRKAYDNQQKEIAKEKEFINRFRSNIKKAAMVQSRIKALDKMELIVVPRDEKGVYFRFPSPPPSSHKVIELQNVSKSYGDIQVYKKLDFRIDKGDRIAIVGANGAGKSTLARILAGAEPFQAGERVLGQNTVIAYFAQQQAEELDPSKTVYDEVEAAAIAANNTEMKPRAVLGALLFSGDDVYKKTSVLSGGEKNRVALAKMLMQKANTLILDEPTNHLDIRSKEVLQDAIKEFQGTMILVSHDRDFLEYIKRIEQEQNAE